MSKLLLVQLVALLTMSGAQAFCGIGMMRCNVDGVIQCVEDSHGCPTSGSGLPLASLRQVTGYAQVRGRGAEGAKAVAYANALQQCNSRVTQLTPWQVTVDFGAVFTASAVFKCESEL